MCLNHSRKFKQDMQHFCGAQYLFASFWLARCFPDRKKKQIYVADRAVPQDCLRDVNISVTPKKIAWRYTLPLWHIYVSSRHLIRNIVMWTSSQKYFRHSNVSKTLHPVIVWQYPLKYLFTRIRYFPAAIHNLVLLTLRQESFESIYRKNIGSFRWVSAYLIKFMDAYCMFRW